MRNYTNVPTDTEGNISLGDFAADYIGPNNKCAPFPIWWKTVHIAEERVGTVVSEGKGNNVESTVPLTNTTAALVPLIVAAAAPGQSATADGGAERSEPNTGAVDTALRFHGGLQGSDLPRGKRRGRRQNRVYGRLASAGEGQLDRNRIEKDAAVHHPREGGAAGGTHAGAPSAGSGMRSRGGSAASGVFYLLLG